MLGVERAQAGGMQHVQRIEIGRKVLAADRALEMPLYNLNAIYAVNKRVENFVPAPDSRLKLNEVTVK